MSLRLWSDSPMLRSFLKSRSEIWTQHYDFSAHIFNHRIKTVPLLAVSFQDRQLHNELAFLKNCEQ